MWAARKTNMSSPFFIIGSDRGSSESTYLLIVLSLGPNMAGPWGAQICPMETPSKSEKGRSVV